MCDWVPLLVAWLAQLWVPEIKVTVRARLGASALLDRFRVEVCLEVKNRRGE